MKKLVSVACYVGLVVAIGCAESTAPSNPVTSTPAVDGSKYLVAQEPEGAQNVITVREAAEKGDDVLIVGRIGGGANPWVEGRAAFTLVDQSLRACSDIPGDQCQTPWDYCCETPRLPTSTALVKVVDENGELIKSDARELLNVKELDTVVVKGKAQRDDSGNLTVLAQGVYVKK